MSLTELADLTLEVWEQARVPDRGADHPDVIVAAVV